MVLSRCPRAGQEPVVGRGEGTADADAPGFETSREMNDACRLIRHGRSLTVAAARQAGDDVPFLIEPQPIVPQDGVESFLVEKVDLAINLSKILACAERDIQTPPARDVEEHHARVEIRGHIGYSEFPPALHSSRGGAERYGLIDHCGDAAV